MFWFSIFTWLAALSVFQLVMPQNFHSLVFYTEGVKWEVIKVGQCEKLVWDWTRRTPKQCTGIYQLLHKCAPAKIRSPAILETFRWRHKSQWAHNTKISFHLNVPWGSEYGNGPKEVRRQMVQDWNATWIPDSQIIWIVNKWTHFVFLCTNPVCSQLVSRVHRTKHIDQSFEHITIWNKNFKQFGIQMFSVIRSSQKMTRK